MAAASASVTTYIPDMVATHRAGGKHSAFVRRRWALNTIAHFPRRIPRGPRSCRSAPSGLVISVLGATDVVSRRLVMLLRDAHRQFATLTGVGACTIVEAVSRVGI